MKIKMHTNWIWREEFIYNPESLPDDWDDKSLVDKAMWLEQHDCEMAERWPIQLLDIVDITIDDITVQEPKDE